jgi:hypothetical protein
METPIILWDLLYLVLFGLLIVSMAGLVNLCDSLQRKG